MGFSRLLIFYPTFPMFGTSITLDVVLFLVQCRSDSPVPRAFSPHQRHHLCLLLRYLCSPHKERMRNRLLFQFLYTFSTFFFPPVAVGPPTTLHRHYLLCLSLCECVSVRVTWCVFVVLEKRGNFLSEWRTN